MKYALISDLHFHNWASFSDQKDGINSRLQYQIDALNQVGAYCANNDIKNLVVAGDVFHVRGSLTPSVLNAVLEAFSYLEESMTIRVIPGNHDLESKTSDWRYSSVQCLEHAGAYVYHDPHYIDALNVVMIPWIPELPELLKTMEALRHSTPDHTTADCIIHAPLNGVIKGIPDIGLMPSELEQFGYRNVFCGHYHNHKQMTDNVWSIGALSHQTWSDVDSLSGFIVVDDAGEVQHHQIPDVPRFVDLDLTVGDPLTEVSLRKIVRGNFVRITMDPSDEAEVRVIKEGVSQLGARGVVMRPQVKAAARTVRAESVIKADSLEASVAAYVADKSYNEDTQKKCLEILQDARNAV